MGGRKNIFSFLGRALQKIIENHSCIKNIPYILTQFSAQELLTFARTPEGQKSCLQGWRQEFSDGGTESSDEGVKIRFSGYYKCQKSPKNSLLTFQRGLACSDGGL